MASTSSATQRLLERRRAVVARGVPMVTELAIASGRGATLEDVDGRQILDWSSGIGVTTLGHGDPAVVQAIVEQAARLQHVCMHVATYEPYVALCERLVGLLPHGEHTKALLLNSGAEAVENAIKIARQATGRPGVLCFTGAFHGRTMMAMTLTSKVGYKRDCGPFAPEVYRLPFPHRPPGLTQDSECWVDRAVRDVEQALRDTVAPGDLAAILIEPVLGEGGFVPAPVGFLRGLRRICDEHGIVLIFDEVQSGFCRTGSFGAYQTLGVTPDLST